MIPDGDLIVLTADSVGLVLDATGGRLPAIVHWGAALRADDRRAGRRAGQAAVPVIGSNNAGRPAAPGRAAGAPHRVDGPSGARRARAADGSGRPRSAVTAILVDGVPVTGYVTAGAASVEFRAVDEAAGLRLTLVVAAAADTGWCACGRR